IALSRKIQRGRGEPRRLDILTSRMGYHGNSALALALSGHRRRRPPPGEALGLAPAFDPPFPGFHAGCGRPACESACADVVRAAIDQRDPDSVCAVLIEPIIGTSGGGFVPPPGYLQELRRICDERGVLLIFDEVLTGLGRTGRPMASDWWPGARPDITVVSK